MKGCLFINDASPAPLLHLAPRQLEIFLPGHYRNLSLETNWADLATLTCGDTTMKQMNSYEKGHWSTSPVSEILIIFQGLTSNMNGETVTIRYLRKILTSS